VQHPDDQEKLPFVSLLDIDPHERLSSLEKDIEGLTADELRAKGLAAVDSDSLLALVCLERAFTDIQTPELASALGFCLAKERTQFDRAVELCRLALEKEPAIAKHYLYLGRVFLMQGKKNEAIAVYMEGLSYGEDAEIIADVKLVGTRRRPLIPILHREHILNRSLGYIIDKMSRRRKKAPHKK
jgi:tetratricopeptide (TPR) repeat protein